MIKNLTKHGNSAALVIDRPILELLGATIDTPFKISTNGKSLTITPVIISTRSAKIQASMDKIGTKYAKTFEELAK